MVKGTKRRYAGLAAMALAVCLGPQVWAALTETSQTTTSHLGGMVFHYEDTGTANSQLVVTTTAKDYARLLSSVQVICSASATITVTQKITRTIASGSVVILLPDIALTATTSGAMYSAIYLASADTVAITVPAAGAGITCSAMIIEEAQ